MRLTSLINYPVCITGKVIGTTIDNSSLHACAKASYSNIKAQKHRITWLSFQLQPLDYAGAQSPPPLRYSRQAVGSACGDSMSVNQSASDLTPMRDRFRHRNEPREGSACA